MGINAFLLALVSKNFSMSADCENEIRKRKVQQGKFVPQNEDGISEC